MVNLESKLIKLLIWYYLNTSLIAFSESPTYLLNNSGPLIAMKFNLLSVAIALAIIVLQHPGGPYNKIPLLG